MSATDPYAWIESVARADPGRPLIELPDGRTFGYAAVDAAASRYALMLAAMGVTPGDRVAVQVDKSLESVLLYLGCLRSGAAYVPINTANTPNEVAYFLADSAARVFVCRPADEELHAAAAATAGVTRLLTLGADGTGTLARAAAGASGTPDPRPVLARDDLAAIVYTSGTTGRAKGAMLTRGNVGSNGETLARAWRFTQADVLLHVLPIFHVHGLFAAISTVLASGARFVLLPAFEPGDTIARMARASVFMGVPTHYTRLLAHPALDRNSTRAMRLFVSGSAPLLAETHREFEALTGHGIVERYGMTETLMNTSNPYDGPRIPGSVGPALPGIEVRVVSPDTGVASVAPDEVGMLEVRGPNVCAGYWRAPEKTAAEFSPEGWFRTGDLGVIGADHYVTIVGRAKDLVISGGYNVYPKEVETELDALPGVLESAVIGVPHPDFGEGVTAVVVAKAGASLREADVIEAIQQRVARYKVPKRVLIVAELPRNTMGKVQKNVLRTTYADLYSGKARS